MDYESSAPVNYTAGKWAFAFTLTYALPVNAAEISLTVKVNSQLVTKTYSEVLPNTFYYQIAVTYAF
jgi:hypothetical protein